MAAERNKETCDDRGDETVLRWHAAGCRKSDCQWKCNDADNKTGHKVRSESTLAVLTFLEQPEQLGLEYFIKVKFHIH